MNKTLDELIAEIQEDIEFSFNEITVADTPDKVKYWQGVFHHAKKLLEDKEENPENKEEQK
jgi:hypothetical protein